MTAILYPKVERPITLNNLRKARRQTLSLRRDPVQLRIKVSPEDEEIIQGLPGYLHRHRYFGTLEAQAGNDELGRVEGWIVEVSWSDDEPARAPSYSNCVGCGAPLTTWKCDYCGVQA